LSLVLSLSNVMYPFSQILVKHQEGIDHHNRDPMSVFYVQRENEKLVFKYVKPCVNVSLYICQVQ
jgi:hypothetical protein